jgi:hypothetical protein
VIYSMWYTVLRFLLVGDPGCPGCGGTDYVFGVKNVARLVEQHHKICKYLPK